MNVDYVLVAENGTINGRVVHTRCLPSLTMREHSIFLSKSGRGHSKHENNNPCTYGQDACDIGTNYMTVADGHGPNGDEAALYVCDAVKSLHVPSGKELAIGRHDYIVEDIRVGVTNMIRSCPYQRSGATMTHTMFVSDGARRWIITVNVGDSEGLIIYKNNIYVSTVAHNWDNISVYQKYARLCTPKPVCYNRWNASKHKMKDRHGHYYPILLYKEERDGQVVVDQDNAEYMETLHIRKHRPDLKYGTQSKRIPAEPHENWGSTVLIDGKAQGQVMASVGDHYERQKTGVPEDMVHVYIHEVPVHERVVVSIHTDGVANERTIQDCGLTAWSSKSANEFLQSIDSPKDDMACCMAVWSPNPRKKLPYPKH